jgi:putative PIN family toxin of toxin-antitoxin system
MLKVVLDANVYVSAVLSRSGNPQEILQQWRAGAFEIVVSQDTLTELSRVLRYPKIVKLHRWTEAEIDEFLKLLSEEAVLVTPQTKLDVVKADESDNRYLECAVAGEAGYLVTGDKRHLLPLKEYQGIRIVSPATFIAILALEK